MHLNKTGGTLILHFYKQLQPVKQIFGGIRI
jgi:hypothetical protein